MRGGEEMNIYLGNLTLAQMQERMGIEFPEGLIEYLKDKHQDNASQLRENTWHCFDIPFVLKVENMEMAQTVYSYLKPLNDEIKTVFQIAVEEKP